VGGSFGIGILNTFVTRLIHFHAVRIGEAAGIMPEIYSRISQKAVSAIGQHTAGAASGGTSALSNVSNLIYLKANVLGFENGFVIAGIIVLASIPLSLMLKNQKPKKR